jgi:DNA-binding transcriptional ArsR family regulator
MQCDESQLEVAFEDTRDLFVAFGDRYRQEIILILGKNPNMTVKELSLALELSRPATSHHIKILKQAGLLGERKEGVRRYYYPTLHDGFMKVKELIEAADGWIRK